MVKLARPGQLKRPKRPDEVLSKLTNGHTNYVACIGMIGAAASKAHGDAITAEAHRRGAPFVVWEPSMRVDTVPDDAVIVVVLYGDARGLVPLFKAFPHLPHVTPLVIAYNAQGEGFASPGGDGNPELITSIFDRVARLVSGIPIPQGDA